MSVQIDGVLLDPYGEIASFAEIRFITLQGAGEVLTTAPATYKTSADGAYSINVQFGVYGVYVRYNMSNGDFKLIQKTIVNSNTNATTLGELLLFNEPLTPPEIAYVEQLVAEAEGYRDEAEGFANDAEQSAINSDSSAQDSAASAQEAADLIALIAPVPLNGGVWASGQTYDFYNQYMIYNGEAYSPLPATALPYTVGAAPDLGFVYQIKLNDHSLLANRNATGSHDVSSISGAIRTFPSVAEMILNAGGNPYSHGDFTKVQGENNEFINYIVINTVSDVDLGNGLWAKPLSDGFVTPTEAYKGLNFKEVATAPNSHLGLTSGLIETVDSQMILLTRKAGTHPQDPSGKIVAYKTVRGGLDFNFSSEQTVIDSGGVDDRDFALGRMNNGRIGLMVGRWDAAASPAFVWSDDNGATWNNITVSIAAPQFFTWFSILPMSHIGPNSFILYGSIEGTWDGIRYLRTDDNGATWSYGVSLAEQGGVLSEATVAKVGGGKWVMVCRQNASPGLPFILAESTDMVNFTQIGTILNGGQNPPYLLATEYGVELMVSVRSGTTPNNLNLKNKIVAKAVKSRDAVAGNYGAWDNISSFDTVTQLSDLLGYIQFTTSPTGALHASVAFRENDAGTVSKLAVITNERILDSNITMQKSAYNNSTKWSVITDNVSGRMTQLNNEITLNFADASALQATATFEDEFTGTATLPTVIASLKSTSLAALSPSNLGQIRVDLISNSQARITLFSIGGSFQAGDTAQVMLSADGEWSKDIL